jgi:hypothetical protein
MVVPVILICIGIVESIDAVKGVLDAANAASA